MYCVSPAYGSAGGRVVDLHLALFAIFVVAILFGACIRGGLVVLTAYAGQRAGPLVQPSIHDQGGNANQANDGENDQDNCLAALGTKMAGLCLHTIGLIQFAGGPEHCSYRLDRS